MVQGPRKERVAAVETQKKRMKVKSRYNVKHKCYIGI